MADGRRKMGGAAIVAGGLLAVAGLGGAATASADGETNAVATWCGSAALGTKYEPVATPFVVPAAPSGMTLTKAVVKAGSTGQGVVVDENQVYSPVVAGQSLVFDNTVPNEDGTRPQKDISHVIVCWTPVTTTTQATTTTQPATTTTQPATTTTQPATTTTQPATTTTQPGFVDSGSGGGPGVVDQAGPVAPASLPLAPAPVDPGAGAAPAPAPVSPTGGVLPVTGRAGGALAGLGALMVLAGTALTVGARRRTA